MRYNIVGVLINSAVPDPNEYCSACHSRRCEFTQH